MNDDRREILKTLSLISQLGLTILTAIIMCTVIGMWLDGKFETHIFTLPLLILGILGGAKGAYRLAKNSVKPSKEEKEDADVSLRK